MKNARKHQRISLISTLHFVKLAFRSLLFLGAATLYVVLRIRGESSMVETAEKKPALLGVIWLVFAVEMVFRFFPSKLESMGCQKQFRCNYIASTAHAPVSRTKGRAAVAAAWIALTGLIGGMYALKWIDEGILFLICLAFSVCDMICILFFCPFQTWFMKNKCCTSCGIYNWDYAMMFSPLIFAPSAYTWSLLALSLALLARWEIAYHRHPERFSEETNASLKCANCTERLCQHKKQLRGFLNRYFGRRF